MLLWCIGKSIQVKSQGRKIESLWDVFIFFMFYYTIALKIIIDRGWSWLTTQIVVDYGWS